MKRDFQSKIKATHALTVIALTGTGPVLAHPGIAGHVTVNPPAHGMVHAMMNAPFLIAVSCLALGGLCLLVRVLKRRHGVAEPAGEPEFNRE